MSRVVVLGSLNMDLVINVPHLPRPGETVAGRDLQMVPGGKGANQAAAIAQLGESVSMIGRVGGDTFGSVLKANLMGLGVDVDRVVIDEQAKTGVAMITVSEQSGENSIVIAPGANSRLSLEDVDTAEPVLSRADALVLQFEVPLSVVEHAAELARRLGLKVILNPAPAYPVSADFLSKVDCLILNETEAEVLSRQKVTNVESAKRAIEEMVRFGVPVVVITLGAKGALAATKSNAIYVPARVVPVVDTTAAGDAFVGAFVVGLMRGMSPRDTMHYAVAAGTLAVTRPGAQTSLPLAADVDAFLSET